MHCINVGFSPEVCNGETPGRLLSWKLQRIQLCSCYRTESMAMVFWAGGVPWSTAPAIYFCQPNYARALSSWSPSQAVQI